MKSTNINNFDIVDYRRMEANPGFQRGKVRSSRPPCLMASGFTLVELLIAISLLLMLLTAALPLMVYQARMTQTNRNQLVATKLASSVIEEIRAMNYDDIGVQGSNPPGKIPHSFDRTIEGKTYTVTVYISWVDDTNDTTPNNYKRIKVIVKAASPFTGETVQLADIRSEVARNSEEVLTGGGNIKVSVVRGWRDDNSKPPTAVSDCRLELGRGPSAPQSQWSDEAGSALFAGLANGAYTVTIYPAEQKMMLRPDQSPTSSVTISKATVQAVSFEVETPCHLYLSLMDATTNRPVTAPGRVTLNEPYVPDGSSHDVAVNFQANSFGSAEKPVYADLWRPLACWRWI